MPIKILVVCGGTGQAVLGKGSLLGFDGEMQVDVSSEMTDTPPNVEQVRLDVGLPTTTAVLADLKARTAHPRDERVPAMADRAILTAAGKAHVAILDQQMRVASPLKDGLAQSPAVGGGAVRAGQNPSRITSAFTQIVQRSGKIPGPDTPVEVWIVASTAGGTGEGVHRFVALQVLEYMRGAQPNVLTNITFVRIGPQTYERLGDQVKLNTFFGIAADSAFARSMSVPYPNATLSWYFLDLPVIGIDDLGSRQRATLVDATAKTLMLPQLQDDLNQLLVNNQGARIVLVRSAYWGTDFQSEVKYRESLQQILDQINAVMNDLTHTPQEGIGPDFTIDRRMEQVKRNIADINQLAARLGANWRFPKYDVPSAAELTDRTKLAGLVAGWKAAFDTLLGEDLALSGFSCAMLIPIRDGQHGTVDVPDIKSSVATARWFDEVRDVQDIIGWTRYYLGKETSPADASSGAGRGNATDFLLELHTAAQEASKAQHGGLGFMKSAAARAKDLQGPLARLADLVLQASTLLEVERQAVQARSRAFTQIQETRTYASEALRSLPQASVRDTVIQASEISRNVEDVSLLQRLNEAAGQHDQQRFRSLVEQAATGLTRAGLAAVLGVPASSQPAVLLDRLAKGETANFTGSFWQNNSPATTKDYSYRILPELEPELQTDIRRLANGFTPVFTSAGVLGLFALLFHGVSVNLSNQFDTISASKFLLSPFVPLVKNYLASWPHHKFVLAKSGVSGEPLDRDVLAALLTGEELEKLAEIYDLVSPE